MLKIKLFIFLLIPFICNSQIYNVRILPANDGWLNPFWNSWFIPNTSRTNDTSQILVDILGNPSKIKTILSASDYTYDNGVGYLAGKTFLPDTVIRYGSYVNQKARTLTFINLDDSAKYTIYLYASRQRTDGQRSIFNIGKDTITFIADTNTMRWPTFANVRSIGGKIVVSMVNAPGSVYTYLNAFRLSVTPKSKPVAVITIDSTVINYPNSVVTISANKSLRAIPNFVQWYQSAGLPVIFTTLNRDSMTISGLRPGSYRFGAIVQDSLGNLDSTSVAVKVNPFLCPICPICPPPVVCPTCPLPRTVTGVNWTMVNGVWAPTFIYSDGKP